MTTSKTTSGPGGDGPLAGERAAKLIARAGICSRRDAEKLIAEGRVTLDGRVLDSPAVNVPPGADLRLDGTPLPAPEPPRLWRYHKPPGVITTTRDPQGRPTVFDRLPPGLPRLLAVGRLDLNSEGLLLLTNDGALKRRLELPATGWLRHYRVRAFGRVDPARLAALARGTTIDGVVYGPIFARLEQAETERRDHTPANRWLSFTLAEGRNREVRRVCEHLGLKVNRLIRVGYGPFRLGKLDPGALVEVPRKILQEQLGMTGAQGKAPGAGFAKAKPRPNRPLSRKLAARRREERLGVSRVAEAARSDAAKPARKGAKQGPRRPASKPPAADERAPAARQPKAPAKAAGARGAPRDGAGRRATKGPAAKAAGAERPTAKRGAAKPAGPKPTASQAPASRGPASKRPAPKDSVPKRPASGRAATKGPTAKQPSSKRPAGKRPSSGRPPRGRR